MTNSDGTAAIVAGWYADYENPTRLRWWDGTQWTEHVSEPAAPAQYVAVQAVPLPATARMGNVFIWILVLLPLATIVLQLLTNYSAIAAASTGSTAGTLAMYSNPGYVLVSLGNYAVAAAAILLAYFDWRSLKRVGVDRPFHWAWAFFAIMGLGIIYVIGRSVIVHRRSGRGLAPLWVHIGVAVVYLVVAIVKVTQLMSAMFANFPTIPTT